MSSSMCCGKRNFDEAGEGRVREKIYVARALEVGTIQWKSVFYVYAHYLAWAVLVAALAVACSRWIDDPVRMLGVAKEWWAVLSAAAVAAAQDREWWALYAVILATVYVLLPPIRRPVLLMGFELYEPPAKWRISHDDIVRGLASSNPNFSEESLGFMRRILERSGTGPATAVPPSILAHIRNPETGEYWGADEARPKPLGPIEAGREEVSYTVLPTVQSLFDKLGLKPTDIDFLIVNCSLFAPTPSLAGMVQHHFQMRSDCKAYNLSGMGCAAGVTSIDLARQLLQSRAGSRCLIISTEAMSGSLSHSNERAFQVQNTLFRMGAAAVVLSNRLKDWMSARYELEHTVLSHDCSDSGYECVVRTEDAEGNPGVRLSRDIVKVAGSGLERNLNLLGPKVLPLWEQAKVVANIGSRFLLKHAPATLKSAGLGSLVAMLPERPKPYMPDWKGAVQHFCIHAGGRAVIDGIEKNLKLAKSDTAPSRATLYHFGNTSSSSIWYELKFIEQEAERWVPEDAGPAIRPGECVLQLAFGSGFKCQSCVWRRLR